MPKDKVRYLEELLHKQKKGALLAYVGDGINDAPVLTRADVGIAMGAMGSDAAIEAADIVLMDDNPDKLSAAIQIARKTKYIVRENIVFALGVKSIVLLLGAMGFANMWAAVFADVGVAMIAICNAIRTLRIKSNIHQKAVSRKRDGFVILYTMTNHAKRPVYIIKIRLLIFPAVPDMVFSHRCVP